MMSESNLPQGWSKCCLPDFTDIVMGQSPTSDTYNKNGSGLPFFQGKAEFGALHPTVAKYCSAPNKIALAGATLLSVRAPVGPTNLAKEKCCIGRGLAAIHPAGGITPMFVLYLLRSIEVDISKEGTGSTFSAINKQFIEELVFGLPPLSEQHRIVAKIEELFSELDKGIENLKTAQSQLKVYRQSLLKHAFEGKLTAQWREQRRAKQSVAPAKAGAQPLNDMGSRLPPAFARVTGNDEPLETAAVLLKRIQQERAQRYQQQLADWEANGKQGSKPKAPKPMPPLTAEELAELPELPEGWGWARLEEISEQITDGDHQAPPQTKEGIPFITISDIKNQKIDFSDTRHVSRTYYDGLSVMRKPLKDDILYTVTGSFGIPCLIDSNREFCFQRHIGFIRSCKDIDKKFLFYLLSSRHVYNQATSVATGTAQKTVPLGGLRLFKIPIMSQQEQEQITIELDTRISEADQLGQTITTSLQQAEALRQSILKKAFSGQLVLQDPHDEPASALLARIKTERATAKENLAVRPKSKRG